MFKLFLRKPPATRRTKSNATIYSSLRNKVNNFLLTFLMGVSAGITITLLAIILFNYSNVTSKLTTFNIFTKRPPHSLPIKSHKLLTTNQEHSKTTNLINNYDFYNLLPANNLESSVNHTAIGNTNSNPNNTHANTNINDNTKDNDHLNITNNQHTTNKYYIQAAEPFRSIKEADELKAQLILQGFEANIVTINVADNDTEYKVMLGPFNSQFIAIAKKEQLALAGFKNTFIKK